MGTSIAIAAFLAGIVMFAAPCTLPLVPAFLSFMAAGDRTRILANTAWYVLGFSIVFISFGALIGLAGGALGTLRPAISLIGGLAVILFGLSMIGLFRLSWFDRSRRLFPHTVRPGTSHGALMLGMSFAAGWTPCVGPVLASILLLAGNTETAASGALLLGIFSLGLAVPFFLTAWLAARSNALILPERYGHWLTKAGGVLLLFIGVLLMTGNFYLLIRWGFAFLRFLGYERILSIL